MAEHIARLGEAGAADQLRERRGRGWVNALMLVVWLVAGAVVFVPFARDTSALDAVTLHVQGNQGNWWHVLVGAPFFLAFPMIWLRQRMLLAAQLSTRTGRRVLWVLAGLSLVGTVLVELPFLRHLAGTSEWQRMVVLTLGLGIALVCAALLWVRRRSITPTWLCIAGVETAYLANAALCLVVYAEATGPVWSRLGWMVTMGTVWLMALELMALFAQSFSTDLQQLRPPPVVAAKL